MLLQKLYKIITWRCGAHAASLIDLERSHQKGLHLSRGGCHVVLRACRMVYYSFYERQREVSRSLWNPIILLDTNVVISPARMFICCFDDYVASWICTPCSWPFKMSSVLLPSWLIARDIGTSGASCLMVWGIEARGAGAGLVTESVVGLELLRL